MINFNVETRHCLVSTQQNTKVILKIRDDLFFDFLNDQKSKFQFLVNYLLMLLLS